MNSVFCDFFLKFQDYLWFFLYTKERKLIKSVSKIQKLGIQKKFQMDYKV